MKAKKDHTKKQNKKKETQSKDKTKKKTLKMLNRENEIDIFHCKFYVLMKVVLTNYF